MTNSLSTKNLQFTLSTVGGNEQGNQHDLNSSNQLDEGEIFDLTTLVIADMQHLPIHIQSSQEIKQFLMSGVLRGIDHPVVRERFILNVTTDYVEQILNLAFYLILVTKFPEVLELYQPHEKKGFISKIRQEMSKNYVKLFSEMQQPKDEIVNLIIFSISYITHYLFYKFFPKQRDVFEIRFVFDCYHIIIYELNGLYVSDFYVRLSIEKIFSHKFMEYERNRKLQLMQQQQKLKNSNSTKNFFGFKMPQADINRNEEGQQFARTLSDKFKHARMGGGGLGINSGGLKSPQSQIPNNIPNNPDQIDDLLNFNNISSYGKNQQTDLIKNLRAERQKKMQKKGLSLPPESGGENDINQDYYIQQFNNYSVQMNCNQVSPTIQKQLFYKTSELPYHKKKMINHAFQQTNGHDNKLLDQLKQFSQNRKMTKEASRETKKQKQSIIDLYKLRQPAKEYYQKNTKVDRMFKEMLDLNYIFEHHQQGFSQLQSSKEVYNHKINELADQIQEEEDRILYEQRQKKKEKQFNDKINELMEKYNKQSAQQIQQQQIIQDKINQKTNIAEANKWTSFSQTVPIQNSNNQSNNIVSGAKDKAIATNNSAILQGGQNNIQKTHSNTQINNSDQLLQQQNKNNQNTKVGRSITTGTTTSTQTVSHQKQNSGTRLQPL